ncbi:MAG TPA: hypothetical protein VE010_20220, partial [Thermoanaerobaculia bacterium]|nr:hypothetical protein [Thermoanaerobaculia bacterium]
MRLKARAFTFFAFLLIGGRTEALVVTQEATNDFIVLYSAGYFMSVDPHPNVLGTFAAPGLNQIGQGEALVMVAHGGTGEIGEEDGEMNGGQLATWLTNNNIPATPISVFLTSCQSGVGGADSLAATAAAGSQSNLTFTGYLGCAIVNAPAGTVVVVQPEYEDEVAAIQQALIDELNPQAQIAAIIAEYQASHSGASPPLATLAQLAYQNVGIRDFFAQLIAASGAYFYAGAAGNVQYQGQLAGLRRRL